MNERFQVNVTLNAIVKDDMQPPRPSDLCAFDIPWGARNNRRI
jgi:hypothetical protein